MACLLDSSSPFRLAASNRWMDEMLFEACIGGWRGYMDYYENRIGLAVIHSRCPDKGSRQS